MSDFQQFVGTGPRSIQTGWINGADAAKTTGTQEDSVYWDFTLGTAVTDYTKCVVRFDGGVSNDDLIDTPMLKSANTLNSYIASARLTSNSNLRISSSTSSTVTNHCAGRYWIIEYW